MREGLICKSGEVYGYLFAKFPLFPSYLSDINQTAYCGMAGTPSSPTLFFIRSIEKKVDSREVEINIKYKINITGAKRVEIAETSG